MSPVVLIATMTAVDGREQELRDLLDELVPLVHANEPDTLLYSVHTDAEVPGRVVMIEKYTDRVAYDAHGSGPTMTAHLPRLLELVGGRVDVELLEPTPLGDARKGGI